MSQIYTVPLSQIVEDFKLEVIVRPDNFEQIQISSPEVNRPGLALAGFYEVFETDRIQLIGYAETQYLHSLEPSTKRVMLQKLVDAKPVAIIYTTNIEVDAALIERAQKDGVPVLRTGLKTSQIMASLISALSNYLAPRITRHGCLVEIYGEGILLLGDSGVGKSETTIELIKRGHRLIADDAVEIKRVSDRKLLGSAPDLIRHYAELRGIGIVDVRRIFGMGAIKEIEQIDLVINLEPWQEGKMYDRLGLDEQTVDILGINIPNIVLPVCPGRNLSVVIEVAAMNNRQKRMGYNTAAEFNKRLMESMGVE